MGDHPLVWCSIPGRYFGSKLEPRRSEIEMIREWGGRQAVDAGGYPFEYAARRRQPLERGLTDAASLHLSARDESPLLLGQLLEAG